MDITSKSDFISALKQLRLPNPNVLRFLNAHYEATGRAVTMTALSKVAGYVNFRGANLQYGLLAKQIGEALGCSGAALSLLVAFVKPKTVTNKEWLLVMHPEFAEALKDAGWV